MAPKEEDARPGFVTRFANAVDSRLSGFYETLGAAVAARPWVTIATMLVIFFLTVLGAVFAFETESRGEKLWIPQDTQALDDLRVYESYFPAEARFNTVLFEAREGNLLSKAGLEILQGAFDEIAAITVEHEGETLGFQDICLRGDSGGFPCVLTSVLENWGYSAATLNADADPLATLNANNSVAMLKTYLGGLTVVGSEVTAAGAAKLSFLLQNNEEMEDGEEVDPIGEAFEEKFLDLFVDRTIDGVDGVVLQCYPNSARSFSDEFGDAIGGDLTLISTGYIIILIYLAINLGQFTLVKMRLSLSLGALVTVGLGVGTSIGLASAFGQFYGPVNSVLPFVLLGLGVDDAFVIVSSLDQTAPLPGESLDAPARIARALGHSGVSITVTSLTDFVAFAISSTTVLPGLSTFCWYAAIGILFLFIYMVTFFTACVALDSRRQAASRVDLACCFTRDSGAEDTSTAYEQPRSRVADFLHKIFAPAILRPFVREFLVIGFIVMLGVFAHGASQLSVESSERNFIPDGSYLLDTFDKSDEYFADQGTTVEVVTTEMDYFASQAALQDIRVRLSGREDRPPYIKDPTEDGSGYESWIDDFIAYVAATNPSALGTSGDYQVVTDADTFYADLEAYLSGPGFEYDSSLVFDGPRSIRATRIGLEYVSFLEDDPRGGKRDDTDKQIDAMDGMRSLVSSWDDVEAFPWSYSYLNWETFKIIYRELWQGTGLALLAVGIITLVLIAHPVTSGLVFLCVAMTIVDILGIMVYWDLVIDNVAVIMLVLAVGLSVDYAAHVGHAFMTKQGTNEERVIAALGDIGAAVLNGAISTFLAVCLLAASASYVFRVLFRLFFATVVVGVGHGLILLPILLYYVGPAAYAPKRAAGQEANHGEGVNRAKGGSEIAPEAGA